MKEKSGFLITYGPLRPPRALRDDFSYDFLSIPLNFKLLGLIRHWQKCIPMPLGV